MHGATGTARPDFHHVWKIEAALVRAVAPIAVLVANDERKHHRCLALPAPRSTWLEAPHLQRLFGSRGEHLGARQYAYALHASVRGNDRSELHLALNTLH